MLYTYIKKEH